MRKLWILFIAIFVASFAVLGWVGTEIFRQAPPIPHEVVTTDGQVLLSGDDIRNGQNVWQAMGGMEMGSIWVLTSRPIGPRTICTANHSSSSTIGPGKILHNRTTRHHPSSRQCSVNDFRT